MASAERRKSRRREARDRRAFELGRQAGAGTLRRHAAARRPRTGLRDGRRHPPHGRAVLGSRSFDPRQASRRSARFCKSFCTRPSSSSATILSEALKIGNRIAIMEGGHRRAIRHAHRHRAAARQRLCLGIRQADEPARRFEGRFGDDAGVDARNGEDDTYLLDDGGQMRLKVCSEGRPERIQLNGRRGHARQDQGPDGSCENDELRSSWSRRWKCR